MPAKLQQYPTAESAHLKINHLLTKLGRPTVPESQMIAFMDDYLARVDALEAELAAMPAKSTTSTPSKTTTQATTKAAPSAAPLYGVQRSIAANAEGRTTKRTPSGDFQLPETGYGRAARAQAKLNADRKLKS